MKASGKTDADLKRHLERVQLSYLLNRDGGWDAIADWLDVLSGGEKQRIAVCAINIFKSCILFILNFADGSFVPS